MQIGRRSLKKAQTRLDILGAVYQLTAELRFRELKVKTIAELADVTEVTFFNYFRKKEDILMYMTGLWALDLVALQHRHPMTGEVAIRRIFSETAQQVKQHPGLMVGFISYLVTNEIEADANVIEPADRQLLYPDFLELCEVPIPNGNEMMMKHLVEIDPGMDHEKVLLHLASCFYGDVLIAHTAGLDLGRLYTRSLDLIFSTVCQQET